MHDMNPKSNKSILNIPLSAARRRAYEEDTEEPRPPKRRKKRINLQSRFLWVAVAVVALCAAAGLLLSTVFAGASITVTPRGAAVMPPSTITAAPNAPAGSLSYQVVTTSRTASTTVQASGTQHVSRAATGILTIYNEYSAESQRLIANTRFEAPDGNIYRIHDSVVVPGTKSANGSVVPGTATASAYGDSPGESYNRGTTQLTIPGFKDDPRYTKFYAKTTGMAGGFVGDEVAVAPADLKTAQDLLRQGLEGALRSAVETQIPKEFLSIPGTLSISYGNVTQTPTDNGKATISESATANADIIRVIDLASAIAKQTVQGYAGEAVDFADSLQIAIALASTTAPTTGVLQLKLSGSPTLVWQFDPNALKAALVGKSKSDFEKIMQSFAPAIQCTTVTPCKASIRPFWSSSFPSNPDKITILVGNN